MASLGHVAVGIVAGRALSGGQTRTRAAASMAAMAGLSLLPDLDYLGVMLGVADSGPCGHRGATHSLVPPILIALVGAAVAPRFHLARWRTSLLCAAVVVTHPVLDAMTVGSRGVPLLWPLDFTRFEMAWRPIPNAPCGLAYISQEGLRVAIVEFFQFMPLLFVGLWPRRLAALPSEYQRPPVTRAKPPTSGVRSPAA